MNVSKLNNPYIFKGDQENVFKIQTFDCGIPSKISALLKFDNGDFTVRFCDDWILCIGNGSMLIWKYSGIKKTSVSSCIEYQIPHSTSGHTAKHALIIGGKENIIVCNDGHVRYWPRLNMPLEYLDGHIMGISQDECLITEKLSEGVVLAVFSSMKIVVIDLRDSSESGLTFKIFTQPRGFITGVGRYFSSFIVNPHRDKDGFKNIKVNNLLSEETEILVMTDNNIDSLSIDVLFNGQYKKEILNHDLIKKTLVNDQFANHGIDHTKSNIVFINFDLCQNIIYLLVQLQFNEESNYILFTYNRKQLTIDSAVVVGINFIGEVELIVIVDESSDNDEPCLLVTMKDYHNVYIVEVLTGEVKSKLNTQHCVKVTSHSQLDKTIVGWACPTLSFDPDMLVIVLTTAKHLVAIKQNINPHANQSFASTRRGDTELDFNLSNASFNEWNLSKFSNLNPTALSTPLPKFDQKGDRFSEQLNLSFNKTDALNTSITTIGTVDNICQDTSAFGRFRKSVVLYWLGYKSQAKRVLAPIVERAQINNDISLPLFVLNIVREIIDEYPEKDPRWSNVINTQDTKGFFYSNKSLLLPQQLQSKRDSLQKLILMLKENDVNLFGLTGSVAPMSVCQCLYLQRDGSVLNSYGTCKVNWSVIHSIGFGIEFLEFIRIFNEIVTSENCDEINQILAKCCQHVLALQRKLTPVDIISQEVSLIPRFIRECAEYLKEKQFESMDANDIKNIFTLLSTIIAGCLKSSLLCRQQFEESFLSTTFTIGSYHPSVTASCWITENQPMGVLNSVVDIINCSLDFSKSTDYHAFELAVDMVTVVLDCFKYRLTWIEQFSANTDEFKRLDDVYATIRRQLITKIVEVNDSLDTALSIADRFADFHWLTSICETLDNKSELRDNCHLEPYLRKWSNDGISEFVLDWYQDRLKDVDQKSQGKLLAKIQTILEKIQKIEGTNASTRMDNSSSNQVIGKFLEKAEVQTTRWLHDIETGEFSQAAVSLKRLAEAEELSLARKKTLLGLAKLSYLANTDLSIGNTERAIEEVNKYLTLISFQEDIPSRVIESQLALAHGAKLQPVIGITQIVKLYLASVSGDERNKAIVFFAKALELMDFAWYNRKINGMDENQWRELLVTVWSQIVRYDDWSKLTIETARETSAMAKVYTTALERGLSIDILMPDLDVLFEFEAAQGQIYSEDQEFLIRGTVEAMIGDSGDMDEDVASVDDSMHCD